MGKHLLHRLATARPGDVAGAAAALCAELEAGRWATPAEALIDFPDAVLDGHRLHIRLRQDVVVRVAINSVAGALLIEAAG